MSLKENVEKRITIKTELKQLSAKEKLLREELEPLEFEIQKELTSTGMDAVRIAGHTLSLKKQSMPNITDKELAFKYIAAEEKWELLPKQILATAFRDEIALGGAIPGVESFEKTTLSVIKLP